MYRCSNPSSLLRKFLPHSNKTFTLLNSFSAVAARADSSYPHNDIQQTPTNVYQDRNFTHGYPPNPNGIQRETQFLNKDGNFTNGYPLNPNGVEREAQSVHKDQSFSTNGGSQQHGGAIGIHGRSSGVQGVSSTHGKPDNQSSNVDATQFLNKDQNFTNGYPLNPTGVEREAQFVYKDQSFTNGYAPISTNMVSQQHGTVGIHGRSSGVQGGVSTYLMPANGNANNQSSDVEAIQFVGTIEELDGYCKEKKMEEAVEVLKILDTRGIDLDVERYLMLIRSCKEAGELDCAKFVHNYIMRRRGHINVRDLNKILDMYFNCDYISDAHKLFENMPQRNLTSWDTMISSLARNGYGEDAIDVYMKFIKAGLKPDGQMFMGVFLACSVVCDVFEGMIHFESMSREYGIVPSMEHYVSVVTMLGSIGYLDEAKEFIESMPIEADVEIWETLMNVCIVHGNTELGNHCIDVVNFLDPTRLTKESKLGLLPVKASSLVTAEVKEKTNGLHDIMKKTQEYRAGDNNLPENRLNYVILKQLSVHMKEAGYVPFTKVALHDVDEESKEEALLAHSEKLAAVHGFMTSPARNPLRIIKNLRICLDCHNAMELMSKITGRQLIVRDTKRFHHFKDGVCSCGNFW